MLGFAELQRRFGVELRARIAQLVGVQRLAAVVALVAPRRFVAAVRAGSFDVAIGQEAPGDGVVGGFGYFRLDVPCVIEYREQLLHHFHVGFGVGVGEEVEGDTHALQRIAIESVKSGSDLFRLASFFLRGNGDGGAVHVAAAHHQHAVAAQAVVASADVRRQVAARQVAQVQRTVGVGPGDADEDRFHASGTLPGGYICWLGDSGPIP